MAPLLQEVLSMSFERALSLVILTGLALLVIVVVLNVAERL